MTAALAPQHLAPVLLRRDLNASGLSDKVIARMVRGGVLVKVRHGAYVTADDWSSASEVDRHLLRAGAVVRQAKTEVVLSHATALAAWGAPTWGVPLDDVHITRTDQRTGRREAGVAQHRGVLMPEEVTERRGMTVTDPVRTAVDAVTTLSTEVALAVTNDLLHRGLVDTTVMAHRIDRCLHLPGALSGHIVWRLADERIESVGESRLYYLCYVFGLPMPTPQYPIRDETGRVIARVDFAWPEFGVFLEFDGRGKYAELRGSDQTVVDVVLAEKNREDLIRRVTGWRCLRIVWRDLAQPRATALMIAAALGVRIR